MLSPKIFVLLTVLAGVTISPVSAENLEFTTRIVGGNQVEPGDYPYFVELGGCGGTLIAPDVVLFAAHCGSRKNKQVSIGAFEERSLMGGAQSRFCDDWVSDTKFGEGSRANYDFALCKLNEPVDINTTTVRLKLNEEESVPSNGEDLIVIGLGDLEEAGHSADYLHSVTVPAIGTVECNARDVYNGKITHTMLCAGFPEDGGKDACHGDSGGPLVRREKQSNDTFVDTLVGVVSWGVGCAREKRPGVYARTSSNIDWIKDIACNRFGSIADFCDNETSISARTSCNNELTIKLSTDKYADETMWTLRDSDENEIMTRQYLISNHDNEHTLCLEQNECYEWTITDEEGDGSCSNGRCRSYSFLINGKTIVDGSGDFGDEKTEVFCADAASLTKRPSSTNKPSTSKPSTRNPTKRPTKRPTKHPTRRPTVALTRAPVEGPDIIV